MAKRRVNKAAHVREYLAEHPDATNAEVVEAMGKKRIKVTSTYVSNIKSTAKKSGGKTTKGKKSNKAATKKRTSAGQDIWQAGDLMFQAVDLVMKAGVKEARSLIEYADKVINRVDEK